MSSIITKFVPTLLLILVFLIGSSNNVAGYKTAHVRIINKLKDHKNLIVRCRSKDDDLGAHLIKSGKTYEFSFRPNIWRTTQFFCEMQWENSTPRSFDIYKQSRDRSRCSVCLWKIKEDGPCMFNYETTKYDICYPWNEN